MVRSNGHRGRAQAHGRSDCGHGALWRWALGALLGLALGGCGRGGTGEPPLTVGLVAPMSGPSGASGEAIQRGMLLAVEEINAAGGALGRPLAVVTRDVKNDPPAGDAALRDLSQRDHIIAVFGGIYGPVMLGQLDALHELKIPLINAWSSVPGITDNGRAPNYAFRVSASDYYADEFLARYAVQVVGTQRPGVLADTTAWGDANVAGLNTWLGQLGRLPVAVERFDQGDTNMTRQLTRLRDAGADALVMIPDAADGAAIARGLVALGWKVPVVSHWGISGGAFVDRAGVENVEDVLTLQTYSFAGPQSPKGQQVLAAYHKQFGTRRTEEVQAQVGVAHGYDGMHLLTMALRQAGSAEGPGVRAALEQLPAYDGLVKRYAPAFTPTDHDALHAEDYLMAVWRGGRLVPADRPRIAP
jgi:branched-chain amino acid transport system substrate-binding protein